MAHLTAVVVLMIDAAPEVLDLAEGEDCEGFRRKLPSASVDLRSGLVDKAAAEDVAEAAALALRDDPELVELRCKYLYANKKITVVSWAGTGKGGKKKMVLESHEVMDVLWDEDHAEEGEDDGMWVAACVELGHDGEIPAGSKQDAPRSCEAKVHRVLRLF